MGYAWQVDRSAEEHPALHAKQALPGIREGGTPSDEGVIESQATLGSIA